MKIYRGFSLMLISFLCLILNSKALIYEGEIHRAEYIDDLYIHKGHFSDNYYQYYHAGILRKSTDNNFVYCLEPFVSIEDNYSYEIKDQDYANLLNLSAEDWHRIELLAYYGYNYQDENYDHTAKKWYYITQMEIWRVIDKDIKIYFTDGLNGPQKEMFTQEFEELNILVAKHFILPGLNIPEKINIQEKYTLNDVNKVLKYYDIKTSSNIKAYEDNNNLIIEPQALGEAQITLTRKGTLYSHDPILYFSNDIQKTLEVGNYTPTVINLNLKVTGSKIKIRKIDAESGEALALPNLRFQILNQDNTPICEKDICEFTTNDEGILELDMALGYGTYILKELDSPMPGYVLNNNTFAFTIDETSPEILEIHFPNKRVKGKITIYKYGEKINFEVPTFVEQIPLNDVILDIYANEDIYVLGKVVYKKGELVTTLKTEEGKAQANLELGSYYIIEKNSSAGNLVNQEPFYFTLEYIDNKTEIVTEELNIYNYLPKSNLVIIKEDQNTHQRLENTIIALYDQDQKKILEDSTNEEGIITFNNLPLGKYYLKEIKALDGYILNEELIPLELTKDKEIIRLTIYNRPEEKEEEPDVKDYYVEVPDTNIVYSYNFIYVIPKFFQNKTSLS